VLLDEGAVVEAIDQRGDAHLQGHVDGGEGAQVEAVERVVVGHAEVAQKDAAYAVDGLGRAGNAEAVRRPLIAEDDGLRAHPARQRGADQARVGHEAGIGVGTLLEGGAVEEQQA
jgi:hypothetical protein